MHLVDGGNFIKKYSLTYINNENDILEISEEES